MSITINGLDDYKNAEILGLEASDRAPNDYLRLTSKVFNSFKPVDPTVTISSYISGLETTVRKTILNNENNLEFYINKGSCFVDDQFIAFTDDIIFNVPISKLVNNVDYYLVIYYQYSNQCLYNPAIFDYVAVSSYNPATMLKIIQFKMDGYDLITYPQNLDDMFIDNYTRLFQLVSDKAVDLFKINSYQGITISANKLYKNSTNPEYSTKSGDVIFLDLDGLYKPARACNRKIDKAMGIYVYNPKSGAHTIVTNGIIDFNLNIKIDDSNKILLNMEPGKSYYLLDNCSETNYAWEDGQQPVPGKISSRFTPGNVMVGYALDNKKMMVNFQYADDMNTANFLELIGLPQQFQDRFNIIYAYWNSKESKDFRNLFIRELQILKEELANQKDQLVTDSNIKENEYQDNLTIYNNTTLTSTPVVTINNVTGPISISTLENTLIDQNAIMNKYQSENQFKFAKIDYLIKYLPDFETYLTQYLANLNQFITYLNDLKDNFSTKNQDNLFFELEYTIQTFSSSFNGFRDFSSLALPSINRLTTSIIQVSAPKVKTDMDAPSGSNVSIVNININTTKYSLTSRNPVGETQRGTLVGPVTTYNATDEVISSTNNPMEQFRNNNRILINTLKNLSNVVTNIQSTIPAIINALNTFNTTDIDNLMDIDNNNGTSVVFYLNQLSNYLFGDPKFTEISAGAYGIAHYLEKIHYFIDNDNDNIPFDEYSRQMETDTHSPYYITRYLIQELTDVNNYLKTLSGTNSEDETAKVTIENTLDVYDTERRNYINTKYNTFSTYQESLREFSEIILTIVDIDLEIEDLNNRISSELSLVIKLENDIVNMDQQIIDRISHQQSVNTILYISDYERKIYNYTYLTIRIRLKQKMLIAVNNDVQIINDILLQLKSQTIPDRSLIDRTETNLNAFVSVLNNLTAELEGMVIEYNKLREEFGINDPVLITDYEFNDHGLADPNLDCFQNLNTFSE